MEQDDDSLEILVSDNSPSGSARDVVDGFCDPRMRYVRPPAYLPMAAHWDFVLEHVQGDLVTIIGDDDGLLPHCLPSVRMLLAEFGLVPIAHQMCNYYWPDFPFVEDRNVVVVQKSHTPAKLASSTEFLHGVGAATKNYVDGPMVYHYFVPTSVLRATAVDGRVFRRSSPDVYSAVAVAATTEKFVIAGSPLTLPGQGARSNGAAVRLGSDAGAQFMSDAQAAEYRSRYRSRTSQLALLDSFLEVIRAFDREDLAIHIDYVEHLRLAWRDVKTMPGLPVRVHEAIEFIEIAAREGVLVPFAAAASRKVAGDVRRSLMRSARPEPLSSVDSDRVEIRTRLPDSVSDIHGATVAVEAMVGSLAD